MTLSNSTITVRLPDDSTRELPIGSTGLDLAMSIGKRLGQAAVATVVNGIETDLGVSLVDGAKVSIITSDSDALKAVGLRTSRRIALKNADLDCKFVKYELYEGTRKFKEPKLDSDSEIDDEGDIQE